MQGETVEYAVDGVTCRGHLVAPDDGPRPGVVIAHAWRGQGDFERDKARTLAELGYVGFAADVYGDGVYADGPESATALMTPLVEDRTALRARIGAAVETLRADPRVDSNRTAAIGFCFGGLTVLELARSGADLRGVVSFHGLLGSSQLDNAAKIDAKVLVLHGYDDPMAPPHHIDALADELTAAGADWQIHAFGNTLHAFTNPAADDRANGLAYDATADARSWQSMRSFFEEVLA